MGTKKKITKIVNRLERKKVHLGGRVAVRCKGEEKVSVMCLHVC